MMYCRARTEHLSKGVDEGLAANFRFWRNAAEAGRQLTSGAHGIKGPGGMFPRPSLRVMRCDRPRAAVAPEILKRPNVRRVSSMSHVHFFPSELGFGVSCFASRTSSGKLSAIDITAAVTSPTVTPSHQ